MSKHRAVSASERTAASTSIHDRWRLPGGLLLGAIASGALAAGALSPAPVANASCLSVSGISIGGGCTSTFGSIAVGIGKSATAQGDGLFEVAFAFGPSAKAELVNPKAVLGSAFAFGNSALAGVSGNLDTALAVGTGVQALVPSGNVDRVVAFGTGAISEATGDGNAAFAAGSGSLATAQGVGNYASAMGNPGPNADLAKTIPTTAEAVGVLNRAVVVGKGSFAGASSSLSPPLQLGNNTALVVGNGSTATAGVPTGTNKFAVALGHNKTVQK